MRADGDIQFAPVQIEPLDVPDAGSSWLADLFEWIAWLLGPVGRTVAENWNVVMWVLITLLAAIVLLAVWRAARGAVFARRESDNGEADVRPDAAHARELLEEADRLASEGRFDEATHLLLQRSVAQIAEARPDLVPPSVTARELAGLPALPDQARNAFATIAARVERSLFALRQLSADDWHEARASYAQFALGYSAITAGTRG